MRRSLLPWLVVGLCVLAAAVLWMRAGDPSDSGSLSPNASPGRGPTRSVELSAASPDASARAANDAAGRLEPSAPDAKPTEWGKSVLEVRVVRDEDDTPIAGAEVSTGWLGPSESRPTQKTNADGMTRWQSNGGLDETISARAPGRATASERVTIQKSEPSRRLVLRLEAQRDVRVHLVDARGTELSPTALGFDARAAQEVSVALSGNCGEPGGTFDSRGAPKYRAAPESWTGQRFAWRVEIRGVQPACVHAVVGDMILASQRVEVSTLDVALVVDPELFARASSPFVVRVVADGDGRGIAGALVSARTTQGSVVESTTDAEGRARFERVLAGEFDLTTVAPGRARIQQRVRRPLADEIVLRLLPGRRVDGLVLDSIGKPAPAMRIAAYAARNLGSVTQPIATADSDAEGRFEFAGITAEALVVCSVVYGDGAGFLPARENLPATCAYVEAGGDLSGVSLRAFPEPHDHLEEPETELMPRRPGRH